MFRPLGIAAIAPFFAQVFKPKHPEPDAAENEGLVVDGVLQHLRELRSIAGEGEVCHPCSATLHPHPAEGSGAACVQVSISSVQVGYLCPRDAMLYLQKHGMAKRSCRAAILCDGHDAWDIGVWLDMRL